MQVPLWTEWRVWNLSSLKRNMNEYPCVGPEPDNGVRPLFVCVQLRSLERCGCARGPPLCRAVQKHTERMWITRREPESLLCSRPATRCPCELGLRFRGSYWFVYWYFLSALRPRWMLKTNSEKQLVSVSFSSPHARIWIVTFYY